MQPSGGAVGVAQRVVPQINLQTFLSSSAGVLVDKPSLPCSSNSAAATKTQMLRDISWEIHDKKELPASMATRNSAN